MKTPSSRQGFALPTVIISAVVMIIVLLAALVGVVSVSTSTKSQLYQRLAKEAAEAGVVAMRECMGSINASIAAERNSLNGLAPSWSGCQDSTSLGGTSHYLVFTQNYRSTFYVNSITYQSGNYNFLSTGRVVLTTNSGTTRDIIEYPLRFRIKGQSLFPSKPATGNAFVCALLSGENWCWGTNAYAEHGSGVVGGSRLPSQTRRNQPGTVTYSGVAYPRALKKADIDVAGGDNFACLISTNHPPANYQTPQTTITSNSAYCWGHQANGQLGNGNDATTTLTAPVPVNPRWPSNQYPLQIVAGGSHACVRTNTVSGYGNVWCWGKNGQGQLARNHTNSPGLNPAEALAANASPGNWRYISASNNNTCAIGNNNVVYCWGDNKWGQTGTNNGTGNNVIKGERVIMYPSNLALEASSMSMAARGNDPVTTVNDGGGHGCAISTGGSGASDDREGEIWCWGSRQYGATGLNIATGPSVRAQDIVSIGGSSTYYADSISTSWRAACAVVRLGGKTAALDTRRIYCWGNNRNGELGVNKGPSNATFDSNGSTHIPQRIWIQPNKASRDHFEEGDVTELTQGGISYRFCAIAGTHNYCWGRNDVGQVGDGTEDGDFMTDPLVYDQNRFYPRLSIFAEPVDKGLIY